MRSITFLQKHENCIKKLQKNYCEYLRLYTIFLHNRLRDLSIRCTSLLIPVMYHIACECLKMCVMSSWSLSLDSKLRPLTCFLRLGNSGSQKLLSLVSTADEWTPPTSNSVAAIASDLPYEHRRCKTEEFFGQLSTYFFLNSIVET